MDKGIDVANAVMARDQHRLIQLRRQKKIAEYDKLKAQSQLNVQKRFDALPRIRLNADLPVTQYAEQLIAAIQNHQVIIVAGETGSGKTTQLPQIAMLAGRGLTGMIGHTQPRRLAARSVSQRIAEEVGQKLGQAIGFKVRFNEQGSNDSILRVMTDGILLAELSSDRYLNKYDTIIIDEAHERSLNIDFILGYLKQLIKKRADLKVIITSATLDVNRFSQYFDAAPIFEVEGRSFPVEVRYRPITDLSIAGSDDDAFDDFEENLPRAVVQAVQECFADAEAKGHPEYADTLIFASTEQEIRELQETLQKFGPKHTEILPLYARLALAEQQKIFSPSARGRRIIIATNVAETALTVPNIRYVIDSGFARISRYSYRSRVQRLPIEAISQAAANQRKGRCGRIAPGVCIRLFSEDDFLSRPEFTEPEIKRTNLASVILQMQSLGLGAVEAFDFIEPPDHRLVNDGRKLLIELGAYNEKKDELTKTGLMMARMPIDPRLSRMILGGAHFAALKETLVVVSALAVQDPRERPADKKSQADQKHALFKEADSDFLFYLKLWDAIHSNPELNSEAKRRQFARNHFLSWLRIREWKQTHQQLCELAEGLKLSLNEQPTSYENLHRALLSGLLSFVANKTDERNVYLAVRQQKARIFPASTLHKVGVSWIMAFEMVETSQVYLRTLAKIEPEWIVSAARELLKYHYFEPHWSKKTGLVNAYAQISLYGLIVEPKRLINFEKVDHAAAHEIFLRDALTTGNLGITPPFLKHNLLKLQEVERVEDKLRRRDLVVDEETIYQFYASKVPEDIASRRSFEDWRATVEPAQPRYLFVEDDALWLDDRPTTQQFPDYLRNGELRLATRYRFDPSHDEDGATVKIPLPALPQVDAKLWSWGILGWRAALIEALLKTLPKDKRRQLVPIPDTVRKLMQGIDATHYADGIIAFLCFALRAERILASDFDWEKIDPYLKPMIHVVDDSGKILAKGRDLVTIQARCRKDNVQPVQTTQHDIQHFPNDFVAVAQQKVSGVQVKQFYALVASKAFSQLQAKDPSGVRLQLFHDANQANQLHRVGVIRLIHLQLGDLSRQLTKQLEQKTALAFAPLGHKAQLEQMLIYATLQMLLTEVPQDAVQFQQCLQQVKSQFLLQGQLALKLLSDIYLQWQQIRQQLMMLDSDIFARNIDDIEDQLDLMQLSDFVYHLPPSIWQQFPRYLKALLIRLERLPHNLPRDDAAIDQVDPWMDKMFKHRSHNNEASQHLANSASNSASNHAMNNSLNSSPNHAKIYELYVLLEELRISLFSQPMKTQFPISVARLQKLWQGLGIG